MRVDDDYLRSIDSLYDEDGLPVERPAEDYDLMRAAERALSSPLIVPQREQSDSNLPKPVPLSNVWKHLPPVAPELIEGVLRQGHKMIISAPSKAGKSFALMELAFAIAEGFKWFGSRCMQGKVLYINMEIDDPSCYQRFKAIYDKHGMNVGNHVENIDVWGLRGKSMPISKLAPEIIREAKHKYVAIIIDPLYKVMDGDENSNSDVGQMVGQFDLIARETGASVIYAHHFAKGTGGDRSAIDRAAGAGAFARDPDAILTMTELNVPTDPDSEETAWRMEYILREFKKHKPVSFWWRYPVHEIDNNLDEAALETSATRAEKTKKIARDKALKEQNDRVRKVVEQIKDDDGTFTLAAFMKAYSVYEDLKRTTAQRWLQNVGYDSIGAVQKGKASRWKKVD